MKAKTVVSKMVIGYSAHCAALVAILLGVASIIAVLINLVLWYIFPKRDCKMDGKIQARLISWIESLIKDFEMVPWIKRSEYFQKLFDIPRTMTIPGLLLAAVYGNSADE